MSDAPILLTETVPGGWNFSHILKRHTALRITDLEGRANVSVLLYNAENRTERLNMPDSFKSQHTAIFKQGATCQSDCGRVLASITHDTLGWHDAFCGVTPPALAAQKYGERPYHEHRNDYVRNGLDNLLVELGKWGLGMADLIAPINFFSKVVPDEHGALTFATGHSEPGAFVELRAEMNTLIVLTTTPHPLDPSPDYNPGPVELTLRRVPPPTADDECRTSCEQNTRAFINTENYFL